MKSIAVRSVDGGIQSSGLTNDQLPAALQMVLDECERQYGGVPVDVVICTWDMDYGDTLPDAGVMAKPRLAAWAAQRRINEARAKMEPAT